MRHEFEDVSLFVQVDTSTEQLNGRARIRHGSPKEGGSQG